MRISKRLTGAVFALSMAIAGVSTASASILVSNQGATFFSMSDFGGFTEYQPMAEVFVGGSNVTMSGFGVYGRAETSGSVRWVVFDGSSLVYQSGIQSTTGGAKWYDSPTLNLTLAAGHTYSMGVIATDMFAWGRNEEPVSAINSPSGLRINAFEGLVQAPNTNGDGVGGGTFAGDPIYASDWGGVDYFQGSVRVDGIAAAVPEPSEWAMLLAGLMVVAFVAKR
jgi:hypothetical protein